MSSITTGYLDPRDMGRWLHQNKAVPTGDFVEGVLLDSFVVQTKRGVAAVYDHCLNPNQSNYYIEFQAGDAPEVWAHWENFVEATNVA